MTRPAMIAVIPIPRRVLDMRDRAHGLIDARNRAAAAQLAGEHDLEPTPSIAQPCSTVLSVQRCRGWLANMTPRSSRGCSAGAESGLGLVVVQAIVA
ncbi:hypothetical protein GGR20_003214 [Devosia subaequoris]|uniref:Uncharacterized protein n=1 Tax=Devosia subaequoris TaxID=395930 RepID=A0A7W6IPP6_9HYPH|nr:hypothetical protein [Devosia subaequoris]